MDIALIDTSIILEPFTKLKKKGEKSYKKKAYALLKYPNPKLINFTPAISISILGELESVMNKKENLKKDLKSKRDSMKEILEDFFMKCEIVGLTKEAIDLAHNILDKDHELDPVDVLHFSTAINSKCNAFIFMDNKLKNSRTIKEIAKEHEVKLIPFDVEENEDKGGLDREITWLQ